MEELRRQGSAQEYQSLRSAFEAQRKELEQLQHECQSLEDHNKLLEATLEQERALQMSVLQEKEYQYAELQKQTEQDWQKYVHTTLIA